MTDIISSLEKWYAAECNQDWEHSFGIRIETLDNPGWLVEIDLEETDLAERSIDRIWLQRSEDDWVEVKIERCKFIGTGDPTKLNYILQEFINLANSTINSE